jgi:hypothetical protein
MIKIRINQKNFCQRDQSAQELAGTNGKIGGRTTEKKYGERRRG